MKLGKLVKVDLRDVWKHEASDFSRWLSSDENLALLGETIGIGQLEPIEREAKVGKFWLDILAKDAETDRTVIIENQLEDSNHDHLGKLITYAAGKSADVVVWIVKRANPEHRKAIEWLNERTDRKLGFFLLEIEMWKIGESEPAPKFNVVESPNEWAKAERDVTITAAQKFGLNFWTAFNEYAEKNAAFVEAFKIRKPQAQNWYDFAIGSSACHLVAGESIFNKEVKVGIYVHHNADVADKILAKISEMEKRLGEKFEIGTAQDKSFYIKKKIDFEKDMAKWQECFAWYCAMLPKLRALTCAILDE